MRSSTAPSRSTSLPPPRRSRSPRQSARVVDDRVDELVRLLDLGVEFPGAILCLQVVLQIVSHVVDVDLQYLLLPLRVGPLIPLLAIDAELFRAHLLVHLQPVVELVSHHVGHRHPKPMFLQRLVARDDQFSQVQIGIHLDAPVRFVKTVDVIERKLERVRRFVNVTSLYRDCLERAKADRIGNRAVDIATEFMYFSHTLTDTDPFEKCTRNPD